jgi:hypothetical protein
MTQINDRRGEGCKANHTFHESYGDVTRPQLAAYRKHNISPSDHDMITSEYGEHAHAEITARVKRDQGYNWFNNSGLTSFKSWGS